MKYIVTKLEKRETKDAKPYLSVSIESNGVELERIGIWDNLESIKLGEELEGEVVENASGFKNFRFPRTQKAGGQSREASMTRVMDRKDKSIEHFQDRKEDSMALAGAMRDATAILCQLMADDVAKGRDLMSAEELRSVWLEWRDWFLNSRDTQTKIPFN